MKSLRWSRAKHIYVDMARTICSDDQIPIDPLAARERHRRVLKVETHDRRREPDHYPELGRAAKHCFLPIATVEIPEGRAEPLLHFRAVVVSVA